MSMQQVIRQLERAASTLNAGVVLPELVLEAGVVQVRLERVDRAKLLRVARELRGAVKGVKP